MLKGNVWNQDVRNWHDQNICIPQRDHKQNNPDNSETVRRHTDKLTKDEKLAKTVSVQNHMARASMEKSTIINCMWPCLDRGYKAKHLLIYWEALRKTSYYNSSRSVQKILFNLISILQILCWTVSFCT